MPYNYDTGMLTVTLDDIVKSGIDIFENKDGKYSTHPTRCYRTPAIYIEPEGFEGTIYVDFNIHDFERRIINHYRFRQIGQETVGRWLHYFRSTMSEVMEKYRHVYEFEAQWHNIKDKLESYNLTETFSQKTTNAGKVTSETSGGSERRFSDTPQGRIENIDSHMTEATKENADSKGSDISEGSGNVEHTLTRRGNIGVQPLGQEVRSIREAFVNVDMMVIEELSDLFLKVY